MEKMPDHDIEDVSLWVALRAPGVLAELLGDTVASPRLSASDDFPENVVSMYTFQAKLNYDVPAAIADEALGKTAPANSRRAN
jgi:hypothetical protein